MVTITSETSSSENHFDTKFQFKSATSDHSFDKQEEKLIEFKVKNIYGIKQSHQFFFFNGVLTITSETSSSEDCLDTKLQARFYQYDQSCKQEEK